jgi:uncharacterized membrane-anchored protein YhcB (DUF1043 family)
VVVFAPETQSGTKIDIQPEMWWFYANNSVVVGVIIVGWLCVAALKRRRWMQQTNTTGNILKFVTLLNRYVGIFN